MPRKNKRDRGPILASRTRSPAYSEPMHALDPTVCRRARLARDRRFDGEFFLAVVTTGIYCRPVCPARPPKEENVRYYRSAAEAAQAGFRPACAVGRNPPWSPALARY